MDDSLSDLLPLYYKRLFPFEPYFRWLNYGNEKGYFAKREFSFTLVNDIYVRYKGFNDIEEMKKDIFREKPIKIDIGAVYTLTLDQRTHSSFRAYEKEFVLDIDISDYDDVRSCCSGANICNKCWKFMALGCKILDATLQEDFGFKHILWVFSGRRGIHGWICDYMARLLSDRGPIAEYLQLVTGGTNMPKKVYFKRDNLHYSEERAIEMIRKNFVSICIEDQDMLGTPKRLAQFLEAVGDDLLKEELQKEMVKYTSSLDRWNAFLKYIKGLQERGNLKKKNQHIVEEIMVQYCYPRLDINVSKGINHLLKSPFSVHPKTGKVCVPFNPKLVDRFDPLTVPTLSQLIDEVNKHDSNQDNSLKNVKEYKKTSLHKSIVIFETFVRGLETTFKQKAGSSLDY